jgi:hypothetical protein
MIREGEPNVTLRYLSTSPQRKLAINNFTEGRSDTTFWVKSKAMRLGHQKAARVILQPDIGKGSYVPKTGQVIMSEMGGESFKLITVTDYVDHSTNAGPEYQDLRGVPCSKSHLICVNKDRLRTRRRRATKEAER